jgi:hypothetical protein
MSGVLITETGGKFSVVTAKVVPIGEHRFLYRLAVGNTKAEAVSLAIEALNRTINNLAALRLELMDKISLGDGGRGV